MKSVFNANDNAELIARIEMLTPSSTAIWGKMNVAQMLAHCHMPIKIAFGELQLKRDWLGLLFGQLAKKKLITPEPFKKNLPTFKDGVIKGEKDFDAEKESLINMVKRLKNGQDTLTQHPHPFFGVLTIDEWDTLQYKHLDHHLRQFGV